MPLPIKNQVLAFRKKKISSAKLSLNPQANSFVCLIDSLRPINNLSVKQGRVFLGRTSTKLG